MRIQDAYTKLDRASVRGANATPSKDAGGSGKASSAEASASATSVKISAKAVSLSAGSARVAELRERVKSGNFQIDAHAIAAKLVGGDEP